MANANVASTANGLNQLTTQGGANVTYDARGNVDVIGSVAYGYLAENRMWVTTALSGGYLYYDPAGRLSFIYDPADPAYIVVRQYSGHELVQERTYSGAIRRRYVFGAGTDEPLVWYEGTGLTDRRWLHADERGSVIAVSDGSGNLVGAINRYDDYGSPQGGSITGRFGYTGQVWIPEIGMYDYRARLYNPALGGRFMQSDPIGFDGGMNLYAYVGNNPVNFTDPLGLQGQDIEVTGRRLCQRGTVATSNGGCTQNNLDLLRNLTDFVAGVGTMVAEASGGEQHVIVTGKRTQRPNECQQRFLARELSSRRYPARHLRDVVFVAGLDAAANPMTRQAYNSGYAAVTQFNTIYVRPSRFDEIANFRSPVGFEEIVHTAQFAEEGAAFYSNYGMSTVGGVIFGLGSRDGNIYEATAMGASVQMFRSSQTQMCR